MGRHKLSLFVKLMMAFGAVAAVLVIVSGIGLYNLSTVAGKYDRVARIVVPKLSKIAEMRSAGRHAQAAVVSLGLADSSGENMEKLKEELEDTIKRYDKAAAEYEKLPMAKTEEQYFEAQAQAWEKAQALATKIISLRETLGEAGTPKILNVIRIEFDPTMQEQLKHLKELTAFNDKQTDLTIDDAQTTARAGNTFALATASAGLILSMIMGWVLSRNLSRSLNRISFELGKESKLMAGASHQLSRAGEELSSSATEQASALQETVASIDEISAMVGRNADNAKRSQEVSHRSHESAAKGQTMVEKMISAIDEINGSNTDIATQMETSNREISEIVKVIGEIGNKTKVINDIVFQTKLLSFNASVEAARAGEHGKGFAVVAEEVGNLAQMSGNAAKEITQMLETSIRKVEGIVTDTKTRVEKLVVTGREKVNTGIQTAKVCGEVLNEIVRNVSEVNQLVNEIATASGEQSVGVEEINKAMAQLDQVTQQNATAASSSSDASSQLNSQAEELKRMVTELSQILGAEVEHENAENKSEAVVSIAKAKRNSSDMPSNAAKPLRKVSGEALIPSETDPRFEDV